MKIWGGKLKDESESFIVPKIVDYMEKEKVVVVFHHNLKRSITVSDAGGRGSSAAERATPGEEDPGSIPAVAARSLLVGSVSV